MAELDGPYSWVVAAAQSLLYFVLYGLSRVSGLLFVATLEKYGTDRETASLPFTLSQALKYLGGPLAGYCAGRFGIRCVVLLGCLLSFAGVAACYLAQNILMVIVCWGILFGIGSCFATTPLPQLNIMYFKKHLTTANGLCFAGASLSGFIMPPIVEHMLDEYGMEGTYLLLSGFALNAIPVAMLLKEPENGLERRENICSKSKQSNQMVDKYNRKVSGINIPLDQSANSFEKSFVDVELEVKSKDNLGYSNDEFSNSSDMVNPTCLNTTRMFCKRHSFTMLIKGPANELACSGECTENKKEIESEYSRRLRVNSLPYNNNAIACLNNINYKINEKISVIQKSENKSFDKHDISKTKTVCHDSPATFVNGKLNSCAADKLQTEKDICFIQYPNETPVQNIYKEQNKHSMKDLDVILNIQFLIISFTAGVVSLLCFVLPTILADFSLDKGISITHSTYLLMATSTTDMVARLGLGWVTDRNYMSADNFCGLCFFILSVCLAALVMTDNLLLLFGVLSLMGLGMGASLPLAVVIIRENIKPSRQLMANASLDVLSVPFLLATSSIIGYFRDDLGSYDYLVGLLCLLSLLSGFLIMLLPYIKKKKDKTKLVFS